MTINKFLSKVDPDRRNMMLSIHQIIIDNSKRVKPEVNYMMGRGMIQYKIDGMLMYGLSSDKTDMSLHMMPIYGPPALHDTYKRLLNKAKFQKGWINFKQAEEMPLDILENLMKECVAAEDMIIKLYETRAKRGGMN